MKPNPRVRKAPRLGALLALGLFFAAIVGCSGNTGPRRPGPRGDEPVIRPLEIYRQLGLLAGSEVFPAVAGFSTFAGPEDSTYVVFGLSLPNSALRFQRDGSAFVGEYLVTLAFHRDGQEVKRVERQEIVRIPSFSETGRTDESILFQAVVALPPGQYVVDVAVRDASSSRGFETQDTLDVPAYGPSGRRITNPVLVYQARGRSAPGELPDFILNPRHSVPYGGEAARLYVEAYGVPAGYPVTMRVLGDRDTVLWQTRAVFQEGTGELRHALVEVPPASLPLGRLWVEVRAEGEEQGVRRAPLVSTISDQWMVANFEQVLDLLAYIATSEELEALRSATGAERRQRWEEFWRRRDPIPASPINEFREEFFQRVRIATEQFGESGEPGWKTDRGEVFIVLGPPDHIYERQFGSTGFTGPPNAMQWIYESSPIGRLDLIFVDRSGFGRYELTPTSRSAFRSVANRLKPRRERD